MTDKQREVLKDLLPVFKKHDIYIEESCGYCYIGFHDHTIDSIWTEGAIDADDIEEMLKTGVIND